MIRSIIMKVELKNPSTKLFGRHIILMNEKLGVI